MPFPSAPYNPVKIDPTNEGMGQVGFDFFHAVPFQNGSNWFYACYDNANQLFEILKSTDGQVTWSVAHSGPSTLSDQFRTFSDGTKLYVAYQDNGNGGKVTFFDYNMATGVFTGPYGATGAPGITILGFMVRPQDGKYIVLTTNLPSSSIIPSWYTFDPGGLTWAGPFSLGTNVSNVTVFVSGELRGVIDPLSSICHCFFGYTNSADGNKRHLFYQQIAAGNTLGNFHEFGTSRPTNRDLDSVSEPILDAANSNIILSLANNQTGDWLLLYGNGLVTPSWAEAVIDNFAGHWGYAPLIQLLGSSFVATTIDAVAFNAIWYWTAAQTATPTAGWSARQKVFDGSTVASPPSWSQDNLYYAVVGTQAAGFFLYFGSNDPTNAFNLTYSLGSAAAANYHLRVLTSASTSPSSNNDLDWTLGGVQL